MKPKRKKAKSRKAGAIVQSPSRKRWVMITKAGVGAAVLTILLFFPMFNLIESEIPGVGWLYLWVFIVSMALGMRNVHQPSYLYMVPVMYFSLFLLLLAGLFVVSRVKGFKSGVERKQGKKVTLA